MGKCIHITEEQLHYFCELSKNSNKCLIKHLPDSSVFKAKLGSWKKYWESNTEVPWPLSKHENTEIVGCHVVDIVTKKVFIYPKPSSENVGIIGHEDEHIFVADKSLMIPFNLEDSNYDGHEISPEEHLNKALSKISFP